MSRSPAVSADPRSSESRPSGCLGIVLKMYWSILGFLIAAFLIVKIWQAQTPEWSALDVWYWLAVVGLVATRLIDIGVCHGETTAGKPATMRDGMVYSVITLACAGAIWGIVRFVV